MALVMPLTRTTPKCSLSGFTAISARSCGMNSPISPVSTVSRVDETSESPSSVPESIMPGIDAQALAFDDLRALGRDDLGADVGDLAVLHQHRNALHLRAGHRVDVHVADQDGLRAAQSRDRAAQQ